MTAQITEHGFGFVPGAAKINAGTDQGLAQGDTVIAPAMQHGSPKALVGEITQIGTDWAEVDPITDTQAATEVRLDAAGDQAVAVGNDPGKPLNLYMVNRTVDLRVGMAVSTAGPLATGNPPGLAVGTITTVAINAANQSPTVTVTPAANLSALDAVEVLRQYTEPTTF